MSIHFKLYIGKVEIGTIENASSMNIGKNNLRDFENISKTNQGLGTILGDNNSFPQNINKLEDPDIIDLFEGKESKEAEEVIEKVRLDSMKENIQS